MNRRNKSGRSRRSLEDVWRLFIAIELPATVRTHLIDHINRLRNALPEAHASWSREENLHLTLKFLGNTPVTRAEALSRATQEAVQRVEPLDLIIGGCGAFPTQGQPRVLWIGVEDPSGHLARIHQSLEDECAKAGFAREPRPFHPHLTIARLRKPRGSRRLAELHREMDFAGKTVRVSELILFRSELRSEGSLHNVVSRHPLAGSEVIS